MLGRKRCHLKKLTPTQLKIKKQFDEKVKAEESIILKKYDKNKSTDDRDGYCYSISPNILTSDDGIDELKRDVKYTKGSKLDAHIKNVINVRIVLDLLIRKVWVIF